MQHDSCMPVWTEHVLFETLFTVCCPDLLVAEDSQNGVATISRLLKLLVSFEEYHLFYRALLQKRPIIVCPDVLHIHSYIRHLPQILTLTLTDSDININKYTVCLAV